MHRAAETPFLSNLLPLLRSSFFPDRTTSHNHNKRSITHSTHKAQSAIPVNIINGIAARQAVEQAVSQQRILSLSLVIQFKYSQLLPLLESGSGGACRGSW
jgi:hypothetical protein